MEDEEKEKKPGFEEEIKKVSNADFFMARSRKKTQKYKISEESARENLSLFLDHYEIYPDEMGLEEGGALYKMNCVNLMEGIRLGQVDIKEDGGELKITQYLKSGSTLEYKELRFGSWIQDRGVLNDKIKDTVDQMMVRRNISLLGSLTGLGFEAISELKGKEASLANSIAFLFGLV